MDPELTGTACRWSSSVTIMSSNWPSPTPSSTNGAPGPLGSQLGSFFPRALELARSTVGQDQGHYRFIDLAFKDPGYSPAIQTALMNPDLYAELVSP